MILSLVDWAALPVAFALAWCLPWLGPYRSRSWRQETLLVALMAAPSAAHLVVAAAWLLKSAAAVQTRLLAPRHAIGLSGAGLALLLACAVRVGRQRVPETAA